MGEVSRPIIEDAVSQVRIQVGAIILQVSSGRRVGTVSERRLSRAPICRVDLYRYVARGRRLCEASSILEDDVQGVDDTRNVTKLEFDRGIGGWGKDEGGVSR